MEGTADLHGLFLFEGLPPEQLAWLAARLERCTYPAGEVVFGEGDPAASLFVLLEGGLRRFRRVGAQEVLLAETSRRGVFAGAVRPFIGPEGATYDSTVRTTVPSTFLRLAAADFTDYVRRYAPMAVHLVGGTYAAVRDTEATMREREYVARLGALSAGLAHELNNPASAVRRAGAQLRDRFADVLEGLHTLAPQLGPVLALPADAVHSGDGDGDGERIPDEEALLDVLDEQRVTRADELADVFATAGVDPRWLRSTAATLPAGERAAVLRWLGAALDAQQLLREIQDSAARITTLVDAVKQYAYLDAAQVQDVDVHAALESVLTVRAQELGGVRVVREYSAGAPRIPAYAAELTHVWTILVDNAAEALGGAGTLTFRTALDGDMLRVDVQDDGPGLPAEVAARVFEPFVTTKPTGAGVGLGLHVAWRIVEQRHHGRIEVGGAVGGTCVTVRLPLRQVLV